MLNLRKIEELLAVPIKCKEGRFIRLMSCDNFIKNIFVYHSFEMPVSGDFDTQIKYSILKFSKIEHNILNNSNTFDRSCLSKFTNSIIYPSKETVKNAILELKNWYEVLSYILKSNDFNITCHLVDNLSLENYIILTNFCGITDFSQDINCSRIIRRFTNFKELTNKLLKNSISKNIYLQEVKNHKEYIESMYSIFTNLSLSEDDFMTFILLFDIRKNRNMFD